MSLISIFVDAFKRVASRKRAADLETARNSGGSLGPAPAGSFDEGRVTPQPGTGAAGGAFGSDVVSTDVSVGSSDPEEGGEARVQ